MRKGIFQYTLESLEESEKEIVVNEGENKDEPVKEDEPTGEAFIEKEYVLYAKIEDPTILDKAESFSIQEQWEIKIPKSHENVGGGRIRIRRIDEDGAVSFVLTIKTKVKEGEKEVELIASEDAFKQFKVLAGCGMHKKRYIFPIEGTDMKWEVDVFFLEDMKMSPYVKIDLEVKEALSKLPDLPPGFTDVITNQKSKQTEEEKSRIQELYNTIFLKKNEFLELIYRETV